MKSHIADIKKWISPSDEYIFEMEDFLCGGWSHREEEICTIPDIRFLIEIDPFESPFSALGEPSSRSRTKSVNEDFFIFYMRELFFVELHRSFMTFLFEIDILTIVPHIFFDSVTPEYFNDVGTGLIEEFPIM
jgi:hypothetical protein